jgi:muramoyltetrapeptide carboxypeptidase
VREGEHLWKRHGYLAGRDEARIEDLNRMIADPDVRMIVAGRGGYGATRILGRVEYERLRSDPKILLGFSDFTGLNLAILAECSLVTFSGAMPGVDLWKGEENDLFAIREMWRMLTNPEPRGELPVPDGGPLPKPVRMGEVEGMLIPANLTLLASLCGSRWLPDFTGAILLIEEIGEEVYRLDRLLSQLENSGILNAIAGLAFGEFTGTEPRRISIDPLELDEVLWEYAERAAVPTIAGIPYGHVDKKLTLPVGAKARLRSATDGSALTLIEGGVSE